MKKYKFSIILRAVLIVMLVIVFTYYNSIKEADWVAQKTEGELSWILAVDKSPYNRYQALLGMSKIKNPNPGTSSILKQAVTSDPNNRNRDFAKEILDRFKKAGTLQIDMGWRKQFGLLASIPLNSTYEHVKKTIPDVSKLEKDGENTEANSKITIQDLVFDVRFDFVENKLISYGFRKTLMKKMEVMKYDRLICSYLHYTLEAGRMITSEFGGPDEESDSHNIDWAFNGKEVHMGYSKVHDGFELYWGVKFP